MRRHAGRVNYLAISGVSNVTGIANPIHEIASMAHAYDALILVDAAQMGFDRICTVNTVCFWKDLEASIDEIYRVLKPDGLFVLSFRPAEEMHKLRFTQFGFAVYQQQIKSLLQSGGFNHIRLEEREDSHLKFICVYASKG